MSIHIDEQDVRIQTLTIDGEQDEYVQMTVFVSVEQAECLIQCRKDRGSSGMYAADCRPLAHAIADCMIAAKAAAEADANGGGS